MRRGDGIMIGGIKTRLQAAIRVRPDFLVIGAQKAGTTSLHRYLSRHPTIAPAARQKELHFFDLYHHRGLGWYLSHFPLRFRRNGNLHFEVTPDYLLHGAVAGRIRHDLGRVKLIAVLREPAERAFSAWRMWHNFADIRPEEAAKADPRSFAQAIDEELAGCQRDKVFHYVAMGRYAEHLDRYRQSFPAEDLLVLDHAEMERDLPQFLDRICDFLEVGRYSAEAAAVLGQERLWASPSEAKTDEVRATLERLRTYYAPLNARLFASLGERWGWGTEVAAKPTEEVAR